mmetsp:Transcript_84581/g.213303  ORF Transcript_84581/g.213303 Transcript_84581/m.213303 type:complete len:265 (-) Transcript_84581:169-963(-)|eukprot:CAMPEP_0115368464 /NCGR_PEP_ID=MMETSP0270-20121206/105831_1 /TAXON_ID=71861 /ORGANISM="Scrippsiella trochoidea, Strain CCMP3099" /LENGTH=264 /DNA_ID=CAMNT_0002791261 /DNA_START=59 /DNA_END=853 /DNA_ORIENTATION=+
MPVSTATILRSMASFQDHKEITYSPEMYAAAGGELLVISMLLSWTLTYFFAYDVIEDNPLKARVGYNNLCVGWDVFPAKYFAAPMFTFIVFIESRFCQLDHWRAQLDMSIQPFQKRAVMVANVVSATSWFGAIGIFSIDPAYSPTGHTLSFVQLVVFGYVAFVCNFIETDVKYHKTGSWVFCVIFGVISLAFGICAMTQMLLYDEENQVMGPVPWYVMFCLDYSYFACMGIQGFMRPAAPSLNADYKLVSDDDYTVARDRLPLP